MVERRGRARLLLEARAAVRIRRHRRRQHLDRDLAPELRVPRAVDLAHPARAERREDLVGPETRLPARRVKVGDCMLRERRVIGLTLSHYLVERRLGAGGMGEVFLARDLVLGRPAAIKLLAQPVDADLRSRLRREAEACARLQHPAIATFYEAGDDGGSVFLAMEYVAGETLRDRLQRGPLPLPQAIALTACLLEALNHAHAAGVLHRDIKPENVMVTADGLAKLLDFGIARLLGPQEADEKSRTATALTQAGAVVGTVGYMSPEQLKGQPLDERSDLFAIGAVLYEMLSGKKRSRENPPPRSSRRSCPRARRRGSRRRGRAHSMRSWTERSRATRREGTRRPPPSWRICARPPRASSSRPCRTRSRSSTSRTSPRIRPTTGSAAASPRASPPIFRAFRVFPWLRAKKCSRRARGLARPRELPRPPHWAASSRAGGC